jgi:1-acyl-sn-glycerol-3-phosphate acyltransferase
VSLLLAAGVTAVLGFPLCKDSTCKIVLRAWCRAVLAALGVRLEVEGSLSADCELLVANHVSWLDVVALNAVRPAVFVCKQEIAAWPVIGRLLRGTGTVFMRRGSARAAYRTMRELSMRLAIGEQVAVFPEGTTSGGAGVLPFRTALLQSALNAGCPIQPVALAYTSEVAVYTGDTRFIDSLWAVAGAPGLGVSVSLLPRIAAAGITRRQAAGLARELILSRIRHANLAVPSHSTPTLRAA